MREGGTRRAHNVERSTLRRAREAQSGATGHTEVGVCLIVLQALFCGCGEAFDDTMNQIESEFISICHIC